MTHYLGISLGIQGYCAQVHVIDFPTGAYLRLAQESDRADLYRVCVQTADVGKDASHLYGDEAMVGEIYVGPYLSFEPEFSYALVDGDVTGYLLATFDTAKFEEREEREWWPDLRAKYNAIGIENLTEEERNFFAHMQDPPRTPPHISSAFPSQVHIDMVTKSQGHGYGKPMITHILNQLAQAGSPGVHLHVNPVNERAIGFYEKLGFVTSERLPSELLMTKKL